MLSSRNKKRVLHRSLAPLSLLAAIVSTPATEAAPKQLTRPGAASASTQTTPQLARIKKTPVRLEWSATVTKQSQDSTFNACDGLIGEECKLYSYPEANKICTSLGPEWRLPTVDEATSWLISQAGFTRQPTRLGHIPLYSGSLSFVAEYNQVSRDPNTGRSFRLFTMVISSATELPQDLRLQYYVLKADPDAAPPTGREELAAAYQRAFLTRSPVPHVTQERDSQMVPPFVDLSGARLLYGYSADLGIVSLGFGEHRTYPFRCVREIR